MVYLGSLTNFDLIYAWTQDKCVPLVREITFENGEVRIFSIVLLMRFLRQNQNVSFSVSNSHQSHALRALFLAENSCQVMSFHSFGAFWLDLKFAGGRFVVVSHTAEERDGNRAHRSRKKCLGICAVWTLGHCECARVRTCVSVGTCGCVTPQVGCTIRPK